MSRLYEFILFDNNGTPVADISKIAQNRSYSASRNEAEELSFDLPLNTFEQFAADSGLDPNTMLTPLNTEVKVKRNGVWRFGAVIGETKINLSGDEMVVSVRCFGYLDSLNDRYVTPAPFLGVDGVEIAWDLINLTQNQTSGDLGFSQGSQQAVTQARDRTDYRYQNVKEAVVNLANLADFPFDFEITHDKKFNTYKKIGADHTDRLIIYPGNIISLNIPRSGMSTYNSIYAIGSGFDDDQISTYVADSISQQNFVRREKVQTWNSVVNLESLTENANAYLENHKSLLQIPQFSMPGKHFDLNQYWIGDRLRVEVSGHSFIDPLTVQRIEKLDVSLDENDSEEITVYFDSEVDS